MRVLFWSLTFWPNIGGMEVLAARLLPCLERRGHEFLVVAPKNHTDLPDEDRFQRIPIRRLPFQNAAPAGIDHLIDVRQRVMSLKRTYAPDLIHINGVGATDFFHLTTTQAHRAPVLVTLHGDWLPQSDSIVAQTLGAADWVVGCSGAILERGRRLAPQIVDRSSVIYNGVDPPSPPRKPLPFGEPRLLYVGRLAHEKGVDVAVEAFRALLPRCPAARLTIAGEGPQRAELEAQVRREGIGHAVDFTGWVLPDQVPAIINEHTLVLMPSRQDSFPLVALEAGLMGRPIVASRVGGLPEIVVHEHTGLLCDREDSASMAAAAARLLAEPELAAQFGEAAHRRVHARFNWPQHVAGYDALYRQVAEGRAV